MKKKLTAAIAIAVLFCVLLAVYLFVVVPMMNAEDEPEETTAVSLVPGEVEGVHYYFRTREEFEQTIENDGFLEYAEYNGNYYGTPEAPIRRWLSEGKNVILEIEVQGAEKVMNHRADLVSIFITIPSIEELERRLRDRATETEEKIRGRMATARAELTRAFRYQYVVLNDEVDLAVRRINTIIEAESMRYPRMENTVLEVLNDVSTK